MFTAATFVFHGLIMVSWCILLRDICDGSLLKRVLAGRCVSLGPSSRRCSLGGSRMAGRAFFLCGGFGHIVDAERVETIWFITCVICPLVPIFFF